jgi:hypothetical protein
MLKVEVEREEGGAGSLKRRRYPACSRYFFYVFASNSPAKFSEISET